jgi:tetratricopeptide (TPR) repeat protein
MGFLALQVKKGLRLSAAEKSPLAEALEQAVRLFRDGPPAEPGQPTRSWNADIDRIVIATDGQASGAVRDDLAKVVARLATAPSMAGERLASSDGERKALKIFTDHVQRLWKDEAGTEITQTELGKFCSVVRVMSFDLQPSGREMVNAKTVLTTVLANPAQADAAWATLLAECQDLAVERRYVSADEFRGALAASHIATRPVEHGAGEVGPVYVPEIVLGGPLSSGELRDRMAEAAQLLKTDPATAAARYKSVMVDLEESGYSHVAVQVQSDLARALRQSGQHRAAVRGAVASAWRPVRDGEVPSSFPEALMLSQELRKSPSEESRAGQAVVGILQYEAGEMSLGRVAELVTDLRDDEHTGELLLWLAEEAVASRRPDVFLPLCDQALDAVAAASPENAEFAGRLRIAVAECREDWAGLLAAIEADQGARMYVLARARYGQALAWRNELVEAIENYEEAISRGTKEKMFGEVRTWLYDLRTLRISYYGPGSLGHDPHLTAQSLPATHGVSVFAGEDQLRARGLAAVEEGKFQRAHRCFMRLRHRMAAGAALIDQRQCETHRGAVLAELKVPDQAVACYLRAGDHKRASALVRSQPDAPLVPDRDSLSGAVWEAQAVYELLAVHGDLVPEGNARELFDELAERFIVSGRIHGWSNFQANDALLKALASLVWASSVESAQRLLDRLRPLAQSGGIDRVVRAHVDLLLGCARVHPSLVTSAARQFADLVSTSEQAVPGALEAALDRLAPTREELVNRLSKAFAGGKAPWLANVLIELGVRTTAVVDHVNAVLDRAASPRGYVPGVVSLGSDVVDVARLSPAGEPDQRGRFVDSMLDVALEPRETNRGRREAIDAIAVLVQRCGVTALSADALTKIRNAMRPLARGEGTTSVDDDFPHTLTGSSAALMLAANRLLLIASDDDEERSALIRPLLLSLTTEEISEPQLLSNALAQAPAELFRNDLLFLAGSRSPEVRALAAHHWAELGSADHDIGRRLAADPVGWVRANLAHGLGATDRPDSAEIRALLAQDCRYTVRAAASVKDRPSPA